MPVFKRRDLDQLSAEITAGEIAPVYLLVGDRFLCREAASRLEAALLPEEAHQGGAISTIDGERENPAQTLAKLRTYNLFGTRQIFKVLDSRLLYSKTVAKTLWEKAEKAAAAEEHQEALRQLRAMLGLAGAAPGAWQRDNLSQSTANQWQKMFGFAKPGDVTWAEEILTSAPPEEADGAGGGGGSDPTDAYMSAIESGLPPGNILLLLAETADKRKKLYKFLEKRAVIIDLSVDTGGTAPARKEQAEVLKNLVNQTISGFGKKIRPDALDLLLERIGFQPVAAVMEAEKLALYAGKEETITRREVDAMVSRTREEAIFELSEAYSDSDLPRATGVLDRLQRGGMHSLAILGGLRNHVRKLLLARAVQELEGQLCDQRLAFPAFQKNYLPRAREKWEGEHKFTWPKPFPGHPYALYQLFRQAAKPSSARLRGMLKDLLQAEYRLKGSGVPEKIILSATIFNEALRAGKSKRGTKPIA